ncbi:MAG: glycosyltransferase [Lapillicoccus sp.]
MIVPAHDESSVIERCLRSLCDSRLPLAIIVSCNGCSDDTAARARAITPPPGVAITVLETTTPSKVAAIRAAEDLDPVFPRLYVDADVVVSGAAVSAVVGALSAGPVLAARPPLRYDVTGASPLVASFYRARESTPELMSSLWGAGFYAISRAGRARWGALPDGVADDLFVDSRFADHEKVIVGDSPVLVQTPRTTGSLMRTLTRVYGTSAESRPDDEQDLAGATSKSAHTVRAVLRHNGSGLRSRADAAVYLSLAGAARVQMIVARRRRDRSTRWERDDTSR